MHVAVNKARHDQLARAVLEGGARLERRQDLIRRTDSRDVPVIHDEDTVLDMLDGRGIAVRPRVAEAMEDRCAKSLLHGYPSTSMTGSSSVCSSQFGWSKARSMTRNSWPASKAISGICQVPRW